MNWSRGLFRLWLVLSVLWIGRILWIREQCFYGPWIGRQEPDLWWCKDPMADPVASYLEEITTSLGPPIVVLALGYALLWSLKGFRRDV
jgi:hypothetical protein